MKFSYFFDDFSKAAINKRINKSENESNQSHLSSREIDGVMVIHLLERIHKCNSLKGSVSDSLLRTSKKSLASAQLSVWTD